MDPPRRGPLEVPVEGQLPQQKSPSNRQNTHQGPRERCSRAWGPIYIYIIYIYKKLSFHGERRDEEGWGRWGSFYGWHKIHTKISDDTVIFNISTHCTANKVVKIVTELQIKFYFCNIFLSNNLVNSVLDLVNSNSKVSHPKLTPKSL